ncbi:hypothetical protein [Polaribacter sp.]|uniref:hypothetical protein n=1 Tax=Polaribacter sp. TaxID=1920175 RepID=UPI003F6C9417
MKITKLLSLFVAITFVLTSCSNNETLSEESAKTNLLKTYKVKRDASGAYSVDFDLENNVRTDKVINHTTNTNEFHLFESDYATSSKVSEELLIDGNKLSIGFIDTNLDNRSTITIEDDNVSSIKTKAKSSSILKEYSVSSNEDGTFNLYFKVDNQVSVDFVYNEDNNIYEVHLEEGKSSGVNFSRNLEKVDGQTLKIDFVNHLSVASKGTYAKELEDTRRKPRIIIVDGTDLL